MPFELCNKNGTANCVYKNQPLSARQSMKSPPDTLELTLQIFYSFGIRSQFLCKFAEIKPKAIV